MKPRSISTLPLKKLACILGAAGVMSPLTSWALDAPSAMTPPGLNPGDSFYIMFVTSSTTLGNLTPAQYNSFVNNAADLSSAKGTDDPSLTWSAWLGHDDGTLQTASLFAEDNSQPIYNLNGDKVGDNYADLVDGSLDSAILFNEAGVDVGSVGVYTGTTAVGGNLIAQGDNTLGGSDIQNDGCAMGRSDRVTGQAFALNVSGDQGCDDDDFPMYAVSPLLTVPFPPVSSYTGSLTSGATFTISFTSSDALASFEGDPVVNDVASLSPPLPDNLDLVDGAIAFTIKNLSVGGSVDVSVDYGTSLPDETELWKSAGGWSQVTASISGSTVTYRVTDGGPLDEDGVANGTIVDPIAAVTPRASLPPQPQTPNEVQVVPALSLPALLMLVVSVGLAGMFRRR